MPDRDNPEPIINKCLDAIGSADGTEISLGFPTTNPEDELRELATEMLEEKGHADEWEAMWVKASNVQGAPVSSKRGTYELVVRKR